MDTERLKGKVVIVTGPSAGIGAAMVKVLVDAGMIVVCFARRVERIDSMANELKGKPGKLYGVKVDLTEEVEIVNAFHWVSENVGPVHILVNNAGVSVNTDLIDGDTQKWKTVIDTNIIAPTIASREAIKILRANGDNDQIINVNSVTGHKPMNYPKSNLYPASKYALTALSETLRLDLIRAGSKIRVSSLSPGAVASEIFVASGKMTIEEAEKFVKYNKSILQCEDIANTLMYIISSPPHVNVVELTIRPLGETI